MQYIDPVKLSQQAACLSGVLCLNEMPRLQGLILPSDEEKEVDYQLDFSSNAATHSIVQVQITVTLVLECQRCNQPLVKPMRIKRKLQVVSSDEKAKKVPKTYDPLLVKGGKITLLELIEEEILLNLPMSPKHPKEQCSTEFADYLI